MKRLELSSLGLRVAALGTFTLLSFPALAEEAEGGSLPQLDATLFPGQIFWLLVSFPLFFLLMYFWGVPKFLRTQENRRQILDGDLSAARKASDHAKAMLAEGEKTLTSARAEVRANVDALVAEANKQASVQREAQEKEIAARLAEANRKIEAARAAALKEVPQMVNDLVDSIVAKVLAPAANQK